MGSWHGVAVTEGVWRPYGELSPEATEGVWRPYGELSPEATEGVSSLEL